MEPKLSSSESGPGNVPSFSYDHEVKAGKAPISQEAHPGQNELSAERRAQEREQAPPRGQPVLPAPVLPVPPQPIADDVTAQSQATVSDDLPLVANDDDLIEKEWVDKAKKIIAETRDDPHKREQEVARLQADYLRKRYGREIGVSDT